MKELTQKMYDAYNSGLSLAGVGKLFNVTRQSVYDRFKNAKLKLRTRRKKPFVIVDGLKFTINRDGYYECTTIDRLMLHNYNYEKVNGGIPQGFEIHHIDLNKTNNDISNLQLLTPSQHTLIHSALKNGASNNKKVVCIDTGETFVSIAELARKLNQKPSNVSRYYIDGNRKLNGYSYAKVN